MKHIFILALISSGLVLSSCSLSRDAGFSLNRSSQKLTARQAFATTKGTVVGQKAQVDNVKPVITASNQETCPASTANIATTTVLPEKGPKKVSFKVALLKKPIETVTRSFSYDNIDRQTKSIFRKPNTRAAVWNPGTMDTGQYLKLWIVFLVAAVVFLVLSEVIVSTSILSAIFGVLLLVALVGFLVFLGIWLWRKSKEGKSGTNPPSTK